MIPPPLLSRIRLEILALVILLAGLALAVGVQRKADQPAPETREARSIPFTDVHPFGANAFLEREVDGWARRKTVELAEEAGLRWAKQHFLWSEIERQPGSFEWSKYDAIVDLYRRHSLEIIARLDWSPPWVRPDHQPGMNNPPEDVGTYARFVAEVVARYRDRIRFYQIWNEPNLLAEWGNRLDHPVDPAEYVDMLASASAAARAADPNVVILSAPLAINLETIDLAGNMNDLDYLEGMYRAGAAAHFDILSANAFGMDRPPEDPPVPDTLNFRRSELHRHIMERHGDRETAVWFNEYGWNAAPPDMPSDRQLWQRVSEQEQAEWTVAGIRWAEEHWRWSGVFNIWYFRQWGGKTPAEADYYFRMVDTDFTPRRLYQSVQTAAALPRVAGPGVWAERSSPVTLRGLDEWRWIWAEGATDRNALQAVTPGASLTLRFRGAGIELRAQKGPGAGALLVHVDGRGVTPTAGTPITLAADRREWSWLPLAEGLSDEVHILTLAAADDGAVTIDCFRVTAAFERAGRPLRLWLLALALAVASLLLLLDCRRAALRIRL